MFHRTRLRLTILNTIIFFLILSLFGAALYFYVKIQLYAKIDTSLLEQAKNVQLTQNGFGGKLIYQSPDIIDPRVFFVTRDMQGTITSQSLDKNIAISGPENQAMFSDLPQSVDKPPSTLVMDGHHYRVLSVSNNNKDFLPAPPFVKVGRPYSTSLMQPGFALDAAAPLMMPHDLTTMVYGTSIGMNSIIAATTANAASIMGTTSFQFPQLTNFVYNENNNAFFNKTFFNNSNIVKPMGRSMITLEIASPIATMQFISNMDPELNMLHSLFIIIIAGVAIGGLLTLLAGFYLAQRALVPIRESWEKQQQFVADASHELRTPLAVIQANTELLLRHPDHSIEQESGYISTILKESKRINKLITSLLTFARSDSNQMEIQTKPVALDVLISECVTQFDPLAGMKHIDIKLNLESSLEMVADEERIHQLLVILMDNALKYTPEHGTIYISANKTAHSLNLNIEDTGIGIPEADMPFIFERFFRSDKIRSRNDGSMGLGLSIAHWIVDKHGGKIRAESQLGKGTRMLIHFPV
jgi:signal transduction histidine kinase